MGAMRFATAAVAVAVAVAVGDIATATTRTTPTPKRGVAWIVPPSPVVWRCRTSACHNAAAARVQPPPRRHDGWWGMASAASSADKVNEDDSSSSSSSSSSEKDSSPQKAQSLLEAALQRDEDFAKMEFEFVDGASSSSDGRKYIPAKICFYTPTGLAIGMPVHPAVVLYKSFQNSPEEEALDPDNPDLVPYFEMASTILQQEMGSHLQLQLTPRVLTVTGSSGGNGLEEMRDKWRRTLAESETFDRNDEALSQQWEGEVEGQEEAFLDSFFQNAFGCENYQEKVEEMATPEMDRFIEETLEPLFDVPGFGTRQFDVEGMRRLLTDEEDEVEKALLEKKEADTAKRVGVRLVAFQGPERRSVYTLVLLLDPVLLVGKEMPSAADASRRLLLTPQEVNMILPKLERDFLQEMQEAGFALS